uniref:Uncharacterized protein n=1 Tax=Arundo donax TaxID=35708 RepID=A0A0A9G273_ARUDO
MFLLHYRLQVKPSQMAKSLANYRPTVRTHK